jgi:hypothetical protein
MYCEQWGYSEHPWWKGWSRRADILDMLFLGALFNFAYVYFFPYSEGVSQAPAVFFFLKYLLWGAALTLIVFTGAHYRIAFKGLPAMMSLLAAAILLLHIIHLPQYVDAADTIQLGNLLLFVPLVLIVRYEHVQRLFDLLPALMSLQVIISIGFMAVGFKLWDDGSLVGLFSNPNSFALALNLAFFRVLARRRSFSVVEIVQLALLAMGLILSRSNSQLIIFVLGVATILWVTGRRRLLFAIALAVVVPAALVAAWMLELIATRVILDSVLRLSELVGGGGLPLDTAVSNGAALSISVTTREQIHLYAWHFLTNASIAEILFGDFDNTFYHLFDSQFLMFAVNYGLVCTGFFLWLLFTALVVSYKKARMTGEWFDLLAWMSFCVTFIFSRVLYYYPINLLFLAWLVHTSTLPRVLFFRLVEKRQRDAANARLGWPAERGLP